jgi:hypothetical protein
MPLYENPPAMTAMRITPEYIAWAQQKLNDTTPIADDDPAYNEYIIHLENDEFTIAPSFAEFLKVFYFVNGETPGDLAPIAYIADPV